MQIQPKVSGIVFGPVTERTLIQRINRKLRKAGELLCKNRGFFDGPRELGRGPYFNELGEYFIVDDRRNVSAMCVNLVELARELGVMRPGETLAE